MNGLPAFILADYGAAELWSQTLGVANGYSVISVSPTAATLAVRDTSTEYSVFFIGHYRHLF